ncbi:MAG: CD1247 N-terminal domain-containing protein [Butyricicoccaceae bacterium]
MTLSERVAYLKGLFEGLDYDKKDSRMMAGILDLMEDMAHTVEDLEEENAALNEVLDTLMETVYAGDDTQVAISQRIAEQEVLPEEEAAVMGDEEEIDMGEQALYQVVCPSCGEEIFVEEHDLEEGSIKCPACGEELEFDMSALEFDAEEVVELPDGLVGEIPNLQG